MKRKFLGDSLPSLGKADGFTLTNIIYGVVVAAALIVGNQYWTKRKANEEALAIVTKNAERIRDRYHGLMKLDSVWRNTLQAPENGNLACLRNQKSCYEKGGFIILRDNANRFVYDPNSLSNGLTIEGNNCAAFKEEGNDGCPFRLDLTWQPACARDCVNPLSIELRGKLRFRPGAEGLFRDVKMRDLEFAVTRATKPAEPRNCYDHYLAGNRNSGLMIVTPDPEQPGFPVFCDQVQEGGGWALAAIASTTEYANFPETPALTPGSTGRLPQKQITAYLNSSNFLNQNNLRLELPGINGGIVLGASTNGAVDGDAYTAKTPPGDCRHVPEPRNEAKHKPAQEFSLNFSGPGEAGISDEVDSRAGFLGFHICFGSSATGRNCGQGCERLWTGSLVRQKGTLWIR